MLIERLQLALMHILPKNTVSRITGNFTRSRLSRPFIAAFIRYFQIDPAQAELNLESYQSLTEFFVRKLKPGLRPVAKGNDVLVSPVDGAVSELGPICDGTLIQAKGVNYSVLDLLGHDLEKARKFHQGTFLTIYLSPRDYHRIHVPVAGKVVGSTYVPGTLFPVNPFGVRAVKGLFARNERLITYLNSIAGLVALVKVGATIVGSVKVNYSKTATNVPRGKLERTEYKQGPVLAKGDEVGRFEFGSTVILLFEPGRVSLSVTSGERVLMGQEIGRIVRQEI